MAEIKTPNEMALKANERKNKEGICRRIFVEHFISLAETEGDEGREGGYLHHITHLQALRSVVIFIIDTMINDQTFRKTLCSCLSLDCRGGKLRNLKI